VIKLSSNLLFALSLVMLAFGLTHRETVKPGVLLLWVVLAIFAAYGLFRKRREARGR